MERNNGIPLFKNDKFKHLKIKSRNKNWNPSSKICTRDPNKLESADIFFGKSTIPLRALYKI